MTSTDPKTMHTAYRLLKEMQNTLNNITSMAASDETRVPGFVTGASLTATPPLFMSAVAWERDATRRREGALWRPGGQNRLRSQLGTSRSSTQGRGPDD